MIYSSNIIKCFLSPVREKKEHLLIFHCSISLVLILPEYTWSCFVIYGSEGNQNFAILKLTFGDVNFKLFLKKWDSERTFGTPHFPAQRFRQKNLPKGREPGLNYLKNFHPRIRKTPSPLARHPLCPIVSEFPSKNLPAMCSSSSTTCK